MTLRKKKGYWYGDSHDDLYAEIRRFSELNGYVAEHFANARCSCGADTFRLYTDEEAGVAVRVCGTCENRHYVGDSEEYIDEADLQQSICVCDTEVFQISVGVALYPESSDIRWVYVGCRCPTCSLVGVYGNWKNEFIGYAEFLSRV
jgi:hypothetical protein